MPDRVDAVITDPPFSSRTHAGDIAAAVQQMSATGQPIRRPLSYNAWGPDDVAAFCAAWIPICRGWLVAFSSHDLIPAWEAAAASHGRYSFAPLPYLRKRPRLLGDGPASWADWIFVCRPRNREFSTWGCLPGWYREQEHGSRKGRIGGKCILAMRAILRDYTRPGDLVADPCAGHGTTLRACQLEGRSAWGAEVDPDSYAEAAARLAEPYSLQLFGGGTIESPAADSPAPGAAHMECDT